jgi:AcrR family transcriptional regulator
MEIAATNGLEGLTIGQLAAELNMSKSGLFAHFDSKEELQLATLRAARRVFSDRAVVPALEVPEGVRRLSALVSAWLDYLGRHTPHGGCLFIESAAEFDGRPGPVRDMIAETMGMWLDLLAEQARIARDRGELAADTDPDRLAWELHAFGLALNWDRQLNGAEAALDRAQAAVRDRLAAASA